MQLSIAYLASDFVGNLLKRLPHRLDGTSGLEDDLTVGASLLLEPSLGAPVDVADDLTHGLLKLLTRRQLGGGEGDALGVLAGEVHSGDGRAADGRARGGRSTRVGIAAVGRGHAGRLLAPGRDSSLGARLDRPKSREGLLGLGVERRLLRGGSGLFSLLLAGGLLAHGGRGRVCNVLLVDHILDGDVVVVVRVLLHQLLRRGETLGGRAGSCFGCHVFRINRFELTKGLCVDGGWSSLAVRSQCNGRGGASEGEGCSAEEGQTSEAEEAVVGFQERRTAGACPR
jgi:hypothetical protein